MRKAVRRLYLVQRVGQSRRVVQLLLVQQSLEKDEVQEELSQDGAQQKLEKDEAQELNQDRSRKGLVDNEVQVR